MKGREYVVVDVETTGLRPGKDALTEVFAARITGEGVVRESFHSLINPGHAIPSYITRLTGITNEMVKDAPRAHQVIGALDSFFGNGGVIVGHNVYFDMKFLNYERERLLGAPFAHQQLCTLLLSRRVFSTNPFPSYRLGTVCQALGVDVAGAHRARADVMMTIELMKRCLGMCEDAGLKSIEDVLSFQRAPLRIATRVMSSIRGDEQ
jgi:DNA polymerase III subunit epsilon